jgi:hypothetical protein
MVSRDHAQTADAVTSGQARTPIDWSTAADEICSATAQAAPKMLRRVADDLYEGLLHDVQDYLRENVAFNLSSELARAQRETAEARDALRSVAEALGSFRGGWPCGPSVSSIADAAVEAVHRLKDRAAPDLLATLKALAESNEIRSDAARNAVRAAITKAEAAQ